MSGEWAESLAPLANWIDVIGGAGQLDSLQVQLVFLPRQVFMGHQLNSQRQAIDRYIYRSIMIHIGSAGKKWRILALEYRKTRRIRFCTNVLDATGQ